MTASTEKQPVLEYVLHQTRTPAPRWLIGLDAGQRRDHTAISVLDLTWVEQGRCPVTYGWLFEPQLTIRGLERVTLGTSYEEVHLILAEKLNALEQRISQETNRAIPGRDLIIDAGGPGPPIVDRVRRELKGEVRITPVIVTGGKGENSLSNGYVGIPRRTLITRLVQMISGRILRCPANLTGWKEFREELLNLSGESTQPHDANTHDDLVMATALAVSVAIRDVPELIPGAKRRTESNSNFGYINRRLF